MDDQDSGEPSGPSDSTIHRVHDRYLTEVVEELGLCPFARKCRESARLHRPIFHAREDWPSPAACAAHLTKIVGEHPDVEVALLTFVLPAGHAFWDPDRFERFQRAFRTEVEGSCPLRFYMVGFHPTARSTATQVATQPSSLAPLLRRTPDPVIQCVRAELLDKVRQCPGRWNRLVESEPNYEIRAMLASSMATGSLVSDDIALQNFLRVGGGDGRQELEQRLADILEDRHRSY